MNDISHRVSLKLCGSRRVRTASTTQEASSASAGASGSSCAGARSPPHASTARARPGCSRRGVGAHCAALHAAVTTPGVVRHTHVHTYKKRYNNCNLAVAN